MAKKNIKPHEKESIIKSAIAKKKSLQELNSEDFFMLSFRHFDKNQGNNFYEWEATSKLAHTIEVLASLCSSTLTSQTDGKKFTVYGDFPPTHKTDYTFPTYIPEDAQWARIHITGLQCVIGHIVNNVFYVVFLDGEHKFWKSELKNT